jgi:hypothetical protein
LRTNLRAFLSTFVEEFLIAKPEPRIAEFFLEPIKTIKIVINVRTTTTNHQTRAIFFQPVQLRHLFLLQIRSILA